MKRVLIFGSMCLLFAACGGFDRDRGDPLPSPVPPAGDAGTDCSGGGLGGGLFGGGGSGDCNAPKTTVGTRCQSDSECSGKESCKEVGWGDRYCLAHCSADSDCGSNGICESNSCMEACSDDSQCHNDFRCSWPWGKTSGPTYCLPDMRGLSCLRNDDCNDPKMTCVGTAGVNTDQYGICTADCSKDASICGDNATCIQGLCVLACKADGDCAAHEHCSSGACLPDQSTTPRPIGAACGSSDQCESGLSCAQTGYPSGYCTRTCTGDSDCGSGTCILINDTTAICMQSCYPPGEQANCRDFYSCLQVKGRSYGVCVPN